MIACLRLKRVRRLLHRYVVPGLCASSIAFGGCAVPATTPPPGPASDSAIKGPIATVSMEPSIEVGDVTAVYVTVNNLRSGPYQENEVIVLQARAVGQSGGRVDRLDVDHAIEKAGGADKLLAALGDRGFEVAAFPPAPPEPSGGESGGSWGPSVAAIVIGLALWPATVGLLASYLTVTYARGEFTDKRKIEDREFPVGQYIANTSAAESDFIQPQVSWKGYLLFPRGSYGTLEITAGAVDDSSVETQCGWLDICVGAPCGRLGHCPQPIATVVLQINRGESPALRHTETIRCPWR